MSGQMKCEARDPSDRERLEALAGGTEKLDLALRKMQELFSQANQMRVAKGKEPLTAEEFTMAAFRWAATGRCTVN